MNKYQEALDSVKDYVLYYAKEIESGSILDQNFATLQELVDNMKFVEEVQTPDYIRVQKELWESKK